MPSLVNFSISCSFFSGTIEANSIFFLLFWRQLIYNLTVWQKINKSKNWNNYTFLKRKTTTKGNDKTLMKFPEKENCQNVTNCIKKNFKKYWNISTGCWKSEHKYRFFYMFRKCTRSFNYLPKVRTFALTSLVFFANFFFTKALSIIFHLFRRSFFHTNSIHLVKYCFKVISFPKR